MPTGDLERFAARMHEKSILPGASVFTAEQPGEAVYVLLRGAVKVHTSLPDGTEVILAVLGPGEVVGGDERLREPGTLGQRDDA